MDTTAQPAQSPEQQPTTRMRRASTEVDKERSEAYLQALPLAERVHLVKTLKAGIDAEVNALKEAAANADSITNGL